jgi:hypothetical protein
MAEGRSNRGPIGNTIGNGDPADASRYRELFVRWSEAWERRLLRGILTLALLVALCQGLLRMPGLQPWLTETGAREGVPIAGHP